MQIKAKMRHHFMPTRTKMKKTEHTKYWRRCEKNSHRLLKGVYIGITTVLLLSIKLNIHIFYDPAFSLFISHKNVHIFIKRHLQNVHSSTIYSKQTLKHSRMGILLQGLLYSNENKQIQLYNNMDKSHEHKVEYKKPHMNEYILFDAIKSLKTGKTILCCQKS